ncbi:NADPH oxidase organizer 1-like [Polymixia lowei]
MHRDEPKVKMFMISVQWSDEAEMIIYRSFQDFKGFHRQLKKKFKLNPLQRSDRVIPKFRMSSMKNNRQQKGSSRSVRRMRFLEVYCTELMSCGPTVTQSSEVTQFFMPKDHDVQPDFTKNSIMILPSDDLPEESGDVTNQRASSISVPLVTQMYRCVAPYETKDTKNRQFKVALDEKLDVLIKDPAGWWLVENEEKRLAWFPAPHLVMCDKEDDDDDGDELEGNILGGALYCAVRNYFTKKHDEVPLSIGAVVEVLRKTNDGWWLIRHNGKAGYVPSMYLQPYNNPQAGLHSLQRKLHSSTLNLSIAGSALGSSLSLSTREPQPGNSILSSLHEENILLQNARSLDVLSEPASRAVFPGQRKGEISISRNRKSSESSLSSFSSGTSSGSESSSSSKECTRSPGSPVSSPQRSVSEASLSPEAAQVLPRVPPRPQVQEILSRCTTMTRKAAMASKARLLPQPQLIQSR